MNGKIICLMAVLFLAGCQKPKDSAAQPLEAVGIQPLPEPKAFVVDLSGGQAPEDIRSAAARLFGSVDTVEPLFPNADANADDFGLSRVYRLVVSKSGPAGEDWDQAYALRAAGGFARVEPDRLLDLSIRTDPAASAPAACFNDDDSAPADKGWAPRDIRLVEARLLKPPAGGKQLGEGIRICHPDTGWTVHDDLEDAQIDKTGGLNLIGGGTDTFDPLGYNGNPGHGTGTGSVLVSNGALTATGTAPPGIVVGVAPRAKLVPIRAIKSVVQVFDSDVARAVNHAVTARCDVVSMSLGGRAFFGLERALKHAVQNDVIVVSAAGNCVGFVVAPASYTNSIAAAATNVAHDPWKGTSKGSAVDISAPGEDVWVAKATGGPAPHSDLRHGDGTSFATAEVAGAAAVWLAFHGHDAIETAKHGRTRQAVFLNALRQTASDPCTGPQPPHDCPWKADKFGAGILDVEKLLKFDPATSTVAPTALAPETGDDTVAILARMFDRDPASVRAAIVRLLGNRPDSAVRLEDVGPEIIDLATRDPATFRGLLGAQSDPTALARPAAEVGPALRARASRRLASEMGAAP